MRKLLSMILCLALCLGVMAMAVSAAGDTYVVAGSEALCNGENWAASSEANTMTANSDGTYSLVLQNVPAGNYEYKIVKNGSEWIGDPNNGGNNYSVSLSTACDVTITYDPATGLAEATGSGVGEAIAPEITVMGIRGEGLDSLSWDADLVMNKVSEGLYECTLENVPAGSWPNIKFAANGNWSDYNFGGVYGGNGVENVAEWNGANIYFEVAELSNVTVELDLTGLDYSTKQGATFTVTITPVSTEPDPDPTPDPGPELPEGEVTVYAKVPADWTSVSAYVWDGANNNSWPGVAMTDEDGDGWYTAKVPAWASNIIINNGGNGAQTQDMAIEVNKDLWVVVEAGENGFVGEVSYEAPVTIVPDPSNPKDGDSIDLIVALMAVSAIGAAVIIKKKDF